MIKIIGIAWKDTFLKFNRKHGFNGRLSPIDMLKDGQEVLLYADGWTHSATSYKGPAWLPPEDAEKLRLLQRHYFRVRAEIVEDQLVEYRRDVAEVHKMAEGREPVFKDMSNEDVETLIRSREEDLTYCQEMLKRLETGPVEIKIEEPEEMEYVI